MSRPLPEVRGLARKLLQRQYASDTAGGRVEAAQEVLAGLAERISPLVGGGGVHLLLQRALKRSRREHPWLSEIRLEREVPWHLAGATEAAEALDPEEVASAAEAVLSELIGLVARFLGADMAIRLVRQSFPAASWEDNGSGTEGEQP